MRMVALKRVANIRVSNVDKKTVEGESAVRLCNYTDVYYRNVIQSNQEFMVATATRDQRAAFGLEVGDVVITKDSETADDIAVAAYVESSAPDIVCGYHLAILRPLVGILDGRFLFWCMASEPVRRQLAVSATGVTRHGLRTDSIGEALVPSLDLGEQRAIADFLDAETARIDTLIAKKLGLVRCLAERRETITLVAVAGGLSSHHRYAPSCLPWLDLQPAAWRTGKLMLLARLGSGHTPSRDHSEWWDGCTIPWITTGEVAQMRDDRVEFISTTRESISELGLANSSATLHPAGTVVLSRTASAGFSAIMGQDMATSQDFVTWTCGPYLSPRYLLLCLRAMRNDLLNRLAQGSTHKTIYMPDVESIQVPLPPMEEQNAIVEEAWCHLRRIDATIDRLNGQIALLHERRQALITAAVTGELDIPGVAA